MAYVDELRFVAVFGAVFFLALMDLAYFLTSRIPPRPRALTDWAGHDGVVLERERREREMKHRARERRVAEHEKHLPMRSSTQRMIRAFLIGSVLAAVPWLLGARMGVLPDLMLSAEQAVCAVTLVAACIAAWPHMLIAKIFK